MIKSAHIYCNFIIIISFLLIPNISHAFECLDSKFLFTIKPQVNQPSDISVSTNGDIYLVDGVNHRVVVFNRKGNLKYTWGRKGVKKGEFNYPMGIDISDDESIFIADSGNHRIQIFSSTGTFLSMFSIPTGPGEKPSDPVDVIVSRINGNVYISDNENHKIKVYDQGGIFQFEWGKFGEGNGEFRYPGIIAQNEYNEIFVVDVLNTRVQKFDPSGNYISEIGAWGVFPGKFFRPKGVTIDNKNRIFVSDSYMGFIQTFADPGKFLGVVCEKGRKKKFVTPVGMAVHKNRLYVVEMRANKLTIIKIEK